VQNGHEGAETLVSQTAQMDLPEVLLCPLPANQEKISGHSGCPVETH
jgi:hypothetical protein